MRRRLCGVTCSRCGSCAGVRQAPRVGLAGLQYRPVQEGRRLGALAAAPLAELHHVFCSREVLSTTRFRCSLAQELTEALSGPV